MDGIGRKICSVSGKRLTTWQLTIGRSLHLRSCAEQVATEIAAAAASAPAAAAAAAAAGARGKWPEQVISRQ